MTEITKSLDVTTTDSKHKANTEKEKGGKDKEKEWKKGGSAPEYRMDHAI